ncbi:MAG: T9SS type A sorting domain-containing protein [Ignavibacteriales bacterium]|nr:T9SS type A sorting domain-containing protein [Ignavibacteriales bacterium]
MKKLFTVLTTCLLSLLMMTATSTPAFAQSGKWSTAYYAGWSQGYNNTGLLPAQNIDFGGVTHIVHFALVPRADGSLDDASNSVTAFNANAIISAAHAAGKKVIITVGGFYTDGSFRSATSSANRTTFVNNLVNIMTSRGYDGIDVDWEPLSSSDGPQFVAFITELRAAMNTAKPGALLTAATAWGASVFAQVKDKFDQINLMTYDLAGAWSGWVTWHNAPITDGGFKFPSTGNPPPSSEGMINEFIAAGIPASKLGIGIDFYGYVWSGGAGTPTGGATAPRQTWTSAPTVQANVPYSTIMDTYYQAQYYRFDNATGVSYLSIDNTGSANDKFISYDDEATITAKYNYVKSKGLGGAIIWELGGGYRSNMPAGQKDLLLQAVKNALGGTSVPDITPPNVAITSPVNGASLTDVVVVAATASDNVGVTGVQFKVDGANIGAEVTVAPYTVSLNVVTLTAGTHTISAVARDAAGNTKTATVSVTVILSIPDITAPTVSLTSPTNNSTVSGTTTLSATATDNVGVAGVQFTVDGVNFGSEDVSAPYSLSWNSALAANGSHSIGAIARDAGGNKTTSSVTVTVSNTTGGTTSDLAVYNDALQSPWINSSWNATLTVGSTEQIFSGSNSMKVAITAAWGGLSLHYGNWGNTSSVSPAQYKSLDFTLFAPADGTQLSIFAENDLGQSFPYVNYGAVTKNQWIIVSIPMGQLSPNGQIIHRISIQELSGTPKTFYVDNFRFVGNSSTPPPAADTTKPIVAFSSPANGTSVSGTVSISANASDNKKVVGVQFKLNGTNLGNELTASPYTISWNTTSIANGTHTLSAVARDSSGNTNGASLSVIVSNITTPPPTTTALVVFDDSLRYPWINTSWSTTATFGSAEQKYSGAKSIKVVQNRWGALRLHNGSWSKPVNIVSTQFPSVSFTIYGGTTGLTLGIWLENDRGNSFPTIQNVTVPANQWNSFTYPMSQLNPSNYVINSIVIQNATGETKTYYIDDVQFNGLPQSMAKSTMDVSELDMVPTEFAMEQNFPNPFNPTTSIRYAIPFNATVRLEVYNAAGQQVALLVNETQSTGVYDATFDGKSLSSGVYFYRLTAKNLEDPQAKPFVLTKRMIMMK